MDINAAMTTATASMINSIGGASPVAYTPALGATLYITALFENEYQEINLVSGMVSSAAPALHCKTTDVSGAKKGDTVVVNSVTYSVTEVKPDGTGMTTLVLRKA